MSDATSESVAQLFGWITRFDISEYFTSDRGTFFTSPLWTSLEMLLGTSTQHATVYNPEVNSMVERFHRTLKVDLITRWNNKTGYSLPPSVLLGLQTTQKEALEVSPAKMVYGETSGLRRVLSRQPFKRWHKPTSMHRQEVCSMKTDLKATRATLRRPKSICDEIRFSPHRRPQASSQSSVLGGEEGESILAADQKQRRFGFHHGWSILSLVFIDRL